MNIIIITKFLFVVLSIINLIINIKGLIKHNYKDSLVEANNAIKYILASGRNPAIAFIIMLVCYSFYIFTGFYFIANLNFMLILYKVVTAIILIKVLNLAMNHFCVEGIIEYDKNVYFNDKLNFIIESIICLLFIVVITYQNIMILI